MSIEYCHHPSLGIAYYVAIEKIKIGCLFSNTLQQIKYLKISSINNSCLQPNNQGERTN